MTPASVSTPQPTELVRVDEAIRASAVAAVVPDALTAKTPKALLLPATDSAPLRGDLAAGAERPVRTVDMPLGADHAADRLRPAPVSIDDLADGAVGRPLALGHRATQ